MKFPPTHHLVGYLTFLLLFFYLMPAQRNIDPTLKVEMPKSQQQKKRREKVLLRRTSGGFSGRGGALSGRGGGGAGRGGGGGGSGRKSEGNLNKLREEEASAIAALHYGRKVRHRPYRLGGTMILNYFRVRIFILHLFLTLRLTEATTIGMRTELRY